MTCKRCKEFYEKYPIIELPNGDMVHDLGNGNEMNPIKCGFDTEGVFRRDNWGCETMDRLKSICGVQVWGEGEYLGAIPVRKGFLIMTWYIKKAIATGAYIYTSGGYRFLTLEDAERIIKKESE